jgi:hypothetical protein
MWGPACDVPGADEGGSCVARARDAPCGAQHTMLRIRPARLIVRRPACRVPRATGTAVHRATRGKSECVWATSRLGHSPKRDCEGRGCWCRHACARDVNVCVCMRMPASGLRVGHVCARHAWAARAAPGQIACADTDASLPTVLLRAAAPSTVQGHRPKHDIGTQRRRHGGRAVDSARLRPVKTARGGFVVHHQRRQSHAARDALRSKYQPTTEGRRTFGFKLSRSLLAASTKSDSCGGEFVAEVVPRRMALHAGCFSDSRLPKTESRPHARVSAGRAVRRCGSWQCPRPQPARARAVAAGVLQCPPLGPLAGYHAVSWAPQAPPKAGISGRWLGPQF